MSKLIRIKCRECGNWANVKVLNGAKMKKVCNRCLHPESYRPEVL